MICCMNPNVSDLDLARRCFEFAWRNELSSERPDWLLLFQLHYELIDVDSRLRRLRRAA